MAAATSIMKKAFMDMISAYAKSVGTESGKRRINGEPHKPEESCITKVKATKEAVEMIDHRYDWEAVEYNAHKASGYVKALAPVALATFGGYICLPVIAGASAFALAGTSAAAMTYCFTNGAVIVGGLCAAGNKVEKLYEASKTLETNVENEKDTLEDNQAKQQMADSNGEEYEYDVL